MEFVVESFINDLCQKRGTEFLKQATAGTIYRKWKIQVPVDKSDRKYDFATYYKDKLYIFESNFYRGGGSKLKSTAGEYRNLSKILKGYAEFVWITDGHGWAATWRPLREAFDQNDYIFNLNMLENGVFEHLIAP